jgi:hypothetical protein
MSPVHIRNNTEILIEQWRSLKKDHAEALQRLINLALALPVVVGAAFSLTSIETSQLTLNIVISLAPPIILLWWGGITCHMAVTCVKRHVVLTILENMIRRIEKMKLVVPISRIMGIDPAGRTRWVGNFAVLIFGLVIVAMFLGTIIYGQEKIASLEAPGIVQWIYLILSIMVILLTLISTLLRLKSYLSPKYRKDILREISKYY